MIVHFSFLKGIPQRIRSDRGTENGRIAAVQRYFREKFDDPYSGEKSFVFGRSTSNQVCFDIIREGK